MPIFVLKNLESNRQKRVRISKETIFVGRSPRAEIPLSDTGVSKLHLVIRRQESGYVFDDLESQNGTLLNDEESEGGLLRHGDVLVVGSIAITFLLEGAHSTSTPTPDEAKPKAEPTAETRVTPGAASPPTGTPATTARSAAKQAGSPPSRPGSPRRRSGVTPEAARPVEEPPPRSKTAIVWSTLLVVGLGLGLGLGYLGSNFDGSRQDVGGASSAPKTPAVTSKVDERPTLAAMLPSSSQLNVFPGVAPEPLGHYRHAAESARVLLRLSIDLLGRPPTRQEFRRLFPMPHGQRWKALAPLASSLDGQHSTDLFQRFLNRRPRERESAFLRAAPPGATLDLGMWLTATEEYRSVDYRRGKNLRQMVTSLIVDFHDVVPEVDARFKALESAVLELPDLDDIVRALVNSAPAQALPASPPIDDASLAAEIYRFRQNPIPAATLEELRGVLEKDVQHLHVLRQTLALEEEYWGY